MKAIKLFLLSSFMLFGSVMFAQYDDLNLALKTGNTNALLQFCSSNVELIFDEKEGVYSKSQASIILKDFFKKNSPTAFNVTHKGGEQELKYVIGQLITSGGEYRVHYFMKKENDKPFVYQLRITQKKF